MAKIWVYLGAQVVTKFGLLDTDTNYVTDPQHSSVDIHQLTDEAYLAARELAQKDWDTLKAATLVAAPVPVANSLPVLGPNVDGQVLDVTSRLHNPPSYEQVFD